ncbi:regulatory protein RecX [Muribaculum sp.]|uniref:regulatory protein RecX n=1 Tax=Muribaculum sp. TaxID=1918611 RepID=UPI0023C25BCC|nr:regulatory protein RecX [Muribaculum sp.]MDE5705414.1 RecX family transcriptional regulator [Muribaculum sp.]
MISKKTTISPEKALERLEALCAKSERCTEEVRRKLYAWRIGREDTDMIISSLQERRYIDDERYAHAYVRDKWLFSHWGRRKILMGLAAKRIPSDIAGEAVAEEIDPDRYYAGLLHAACARLLRLGGTDAGYEEGTKVLRSLVSAGYEPSLAARAVREAASQIAEEAEGYDGAD